MKITALNEGVYTVNPQKVFTPFQEGDSIFPNGKNLKMSVCPFVVEIGGETILLDTGLGFFHDNDPFIHHQLRAHGFEPGQVTKVLLSHLHKDHIDGVGYRNADGAYIANFPQASIYLQKREIDYAYTRLDNPSFNKQGLEDLCKLPNLVLLDDDQGQINEYIRYEVTGGHTPFHQVFWLRDQDEVAFYGADNLPQKSYFKYPFAYKSDYDGKKAMAQRLVWKEKAQAEHWAILFYHDIKNNVQQY